MTTRINTPRLRHRRICRASRALLIDATYEAFTRSHRGKLASKQIGAIKAGIMTSSTVDKLQARGKKGTLNAHIYLEQHIGDLLEGRGNLDTLCLIHSWMGHMLYSCIQRAKGYRRGHIERAWLDYAIRALCAGRRAVFSAWQRLERTGKVGFSGQEIAPFREGCKEAFFVAEHISKSELRAAYAFSDAKAARQGLTIKRVGAAF